MEYAYNGYKKQFILVGYYGKHYQKNVYTEISIDFCEYQEVLDILQGMQDTNVITVCSIIRWNRSF